MTRSLDEDFVVRIRLVRKCWRSSLAAAWATAVAVSRRADESWLGDMLVTVHGDGSWAISGIYGLVGGAEYKPDLVRYN